MAKHGTFYEFGSDARWKNGNAHRYDWVLFDTTGGEVVLGQLLGLDWATATLVVKVSGEVSQFLMEDVDVPSMGVIPRV